MLERHRLEPCRATLEMALNIEYSAYDLSRNMAHRFQGQPLETAFNAIAEAENMRIAAEALSFCREGWELLREKPSDGTIFPVYQSG